MKRTGKASGLEAARFQTAVAWVLVSLQQVCVAMSMSDLMVCEGRAFRRCLGHKDRALMNGIHVLFFILRFFDVGHFFKVFIEFVTVSLLFYVLVFGLQGVWDPTSPPGMDPHPLNRKVQS